MKAYAWRSGLIEFGRRCPDGALLIASGPAKIVRPIVEVNAVHCWDNKSLRVGNVATANDDDEAYSALCEFQDRVGAQINKRLHARQEASHAQA